MLNITTCKYCGDEIQHIKVRRPRSVCDECRRMVGNNYQKYWHHIRLKKEKRPAMRSECAEMCRPCVWISCKHHMIWLLMVDGNKTSHTLQERMCQFLHSKSVDDFVDIIDNLTDTCTLDVADRGENTLEQISFIMGISRERVRQIEDLAALPKMRKSIRDREVWM